MGQNRRFEHLELASLNLRFLLNFIVNLSIRISKSPPSASPKPLYVILKKTKEMKFIIIILTVLFPFISKGQTEFLDKIKIYKINDPKLKEIEFCVFKKDIDKKKPLLLFLFYN